jgi:hypothetical protein
MKTRSGIYPADKRRAIKMGAIRRNIEGHNIEDKLHCTASRLDKTWLKSSLAIYHYVKFNNWMIFARLGDKEQTRRQYMAEMCFRRG